MRKGLLCAIACISLVLVACSGDKTAEKEKKDYSEYVTLGEYKGMELTEKNLEVTEEDLQNKIQQILVKNSTVEKIREGAVKKGDTVNIDFKGMKDGVAFDNGTATDQSLTIGSKTFIDGFEDGLIGKKPGETVNLDLTFPENYGNDELSGQDVVFEVTVNYIEGEKITPKWTDSFVAGITNYNTAKEYEQELKEQLKQDAKENAKYEVEYMALDKLVKLCTYDGLPKDEVKSYSDSMKQYYKDYAKNNNTTYKELLQNTFQMTEEQFNDQVKTTAESAIKQKVAVYVVAETEKLKPEKTELAKKELEIAKQYGYDTIDAFSENYGDDYAEQLVIKQIVVDFLEDNAKLVKESASTNTEESTPSEEVTE